jgi:hypothetical protein
MLIEGEEEAGSRGFEQVVARHKVRLLDSSKMIPTNRNTQDEIGHIDGILIRFMDPYIDGEYGN